MAVARMRRLKSDRRASFYIFLAPWILGFLVFQLVPIGWGFMTSLTNRMAFSQTWKFISFKNYATALTNPDVLYSFMITFVYALIHTTLAILTGLLIALLLERKVPGRGVFRTILYFPYMLPLVAVGWIFKIFLDRDTGFLNEVLVRLGMLNEPVAWLQMYPLQSILALAFWQAGWSLVIFLGGLATIPNELYEVATMDGARYGRRLRRITLPLLSPFILFQFVASMIYAMQTFIQPYIMSPRPRRGENLFIEVPPRETYFVMAQAYQQVITSHRFAYGIAMLWMLFAAILVITVIFIRLGGFMVYTEVEEKR
jgi:multiple sugar transport system permease protein